MARVDGPYPYSAYTPAPRIAYSCGRASHGSGAVATSGWVARTRCTSVDPDRGSDSRNSGRGVTGVPPARRRDPPDQQHQPRGSAHRRHHDVVVVERRLEGGAQPVAPNHRLGDVSGEGLPEDGRLLEPLDPVGVQGDAGVVVVLLLHGLE